MIENSDAVQPEKAVSSEIINSIINEIFKETGHRISNDDPVLIVALLNEITIKKQRDQLDKNTRLIADAFKEIIDGSGQDVIDRFRKIISACDDVNDEISETVDKGKNELTKHTIGLTTSIKSEFDTIITDLKKTHSEIKKDLKKSPSNNSSKKNYFLLIPMIVTIALVSGLCGYIYVDKTNTIKLYQNGYADLHKIAVSDANKLNKSEKTNSIDKINAIDNRQ